ncbi:cheY-like receiver [Vibrio ishigakensis]|uniref:CheY-like receiver n=1 Tax=Vibrio ishigakensis TaxID=1481914 RepID=A0A0B8QMR5_9VIBR|nr:cheY-like receiver [Vibrio ishigakensis]
MPDMDGFKATKSIRELEKERGLNTRTPIIALTASVVDDDIQTCFDVGMDDYMAKPFKIEQLKTKIEKAINLPVKTATKESTPPESNAKKVVTQTQEAPSRSERVLLVEDNIVNQKVASVLLQKAGFEYEIAENGQIAVEMFQRDNSFDIILMDCMMPVMDGFQATKEIRPMSKMKAT